MAAIYDMLRTVLIEDFQFRVMESPAESFIVFNVSTRNNMLTCVADAREKAQQYMILVTCPIKVPADMRPDVAMKLAEMNWNLIIGSFEMNPLTGEVRLRMGTDVEHLELTREHVRLTIGLCVTAMDRCVPRILAAMGGAISGPPEATALPQNHPNSNS